MAERPMHEMVHNGAVAMDGESLPAGFPLETNRPMK